MSDHRFDYPTAASPTTSLVFVRGAQLVGDNPQIRMNQASKRTPGGTLRVKSYGAPNQVFPLTTIFAESSASEADEADVLSWIETVCVGGVNTFQWTDAAGTVRTVRMTNEGTVELQKSGTGTRKVQWMLEVV